MTTPVKFALVFIVALGVMIILKKGPLFMMGELFEEGNLIREIQNAESAEERTRLIHELEAMPVNVCSFSGRWMGVHAVRSPGGWDDEGFDHRRTNTPRDIELLAGVSYGVSDIENGGLHQFFINGTGGMAPEMIEWFERSGLQETADHLQKAMAVFGEPYPRSQAARNTFLQKFEGDTREEYDPFYEMDGPFYDSYHEGGRTFSDHEDRWLREVCGIDSLHTGMPPVD